MSTDKPGKPEVREVLSNHIEQSDAASRKGVAEVYACPNSAKQQKGCHESTVSAVTRDLLTGAVDEVENHPGRVAANVGTGIVVAVVSPFVAPEALIGAAGVGTALEIHNLAGQVEGPMAPVIQTLSSPDMPSNIMIGANIVGSSITLYQKAKHFFQDTKTVTHGDPSSPEVVQAHQRLQQVGATGLDVAAASVGGPAKEAGTQAAIAAVKMGDQMAADFIATMENAATGGLRPAYALATTDNPELVAGVSTGGGDLHLWAGRIIPGQLSLRNSTDHPNASGSANSGDQQNETSRSVGGEPPKSGDQPDTGKQPHAGDRRRALLAAHGLEAPEPVPGQLVDIGMDINNMTPEQFRAFRMTAAHVNNERELSGLIIVSKDGKQYFSGVLWEKFEDAEYRGAPYIYKNLNNLVKRANQLGGKVVLWTHPEAEWTDHASFANLVDRQKVSGGIVSPR